MSGELPPPAPRVCLGREELIESILGLAENLEPIALIGAGGIGKTNIALTVLHHSRIKDRFGDNRKFVRCDQFPASHIHFLARLSKVVGAGIDNPEDLTPLRPFLSSMEMILFLDNAESILDPQGTYAQEIHTVVDELSRFPNICLGITSRISTVPPHCKHPTIPALSTESACDIFYTIYNNGGRSSIIGDLVRRLDFHALSITLLATAASQNMWDYGRLAKKWHAQRAKVLRANYNQSLAATIELSFTSPTFRGLGPIARELLGVVAFFPQGINEDNLDWLFPTISDIEDIFDQFCILSLTSRNNGFITMLAPIRDYLGPEDPKSFLLLRTTKDRYFTKLSIDVHPSKPKFEQARWITSEDINVVHLLSVFTSTNTTTDDVWDTCGRFMEHLFWHKPRKTVLGPRIESLPDLHHSKPNCLFRLSQLFARVGNYTKQKQLLIHTLELERGQGNAPRIARALRQLSDANRWLKLYKEGISRAKEALEIYERLGDTSEQAISLNNLALLLFRDNQLDAAETAASRSITLVPENDQEFLVCTSHRVLGLVYRSKGEKEKAFRHFKTALAIASPFEWRDQLFWIHYNLAWLFRDEGEVNDARDHIGRAETHAIGNLYLVGRAAGMRGEILHQQGRFEDAESETLRALGIFEKLGATREAEDCREILRNLGNLHS